MASIKEKFIQSVIQTHPDLKTEALDQLISENLICAHPVRLPKIVKDQADDLVAKLYEIRTLQQKPQFLQSLFNKGQLVDPGHASVCMSYDVHWSTASNKLKLIEINTNASFLFLSYHLYKSHGVDLERIKNLPEIIKRSFENEKLLWSKASEKILGASNLSANQKDTQIKKIAIVDANPKEQKLFIEFLIANSFFKSWGWDSEICDVKDLTEKFDFIYNRTTDFYFTQDESATLCKIWKDHNGCVSPQPAEYFYLADKQRMIEWFQPEWQVVLANHPLLVQALHDYVPPCLSMDSMDLEQIWTARKKYFFKPKNAFGSKQAYSGDSISRKMIQSLDLSLFIAQEKIPAPEVEIETPEGPKKFKYDLRILAYQDKVQNIVARLYQGQVTNLSSNYGGFAPIVFE